MKLRQSAFGHVSDWSKLQTPMLWPFQVPGVTDAPGVKPASIRRVAVIGGGLMGAGITTALITAGIPVLLKEINAGFLQQGLDRVKGESGLPSVLYHLNSTICTVLYVLY